MKHLKLLEAIALLLILGSWCLEWSSIQKWTDVDNNYWRFVMSFHDAAIKLNDQVQIQFELSINRSTNVSKLDSQDFASAYKLAWDYAEVRKLWFQRASSKIIRANTLVNNLILFKEKYDLDVKYDLLDFKRKIQGVESELVMYLDKQDPTTKIVPIPRKESLSLIKAGTLDNRIQDILSETIIPINEVNNSIKAKRDMWSFIFRMLFAIGSLIMISAKIGEWWKERNESCPNKR